MKNHENTTKCILLLGHVQAQQKYFSDAIKSFMKVVEIYESQPRNSSVSKLLADLYFMVGILYELMGEDSTAVINFDLSSRHYAQS